MKVIETTVYTLSELSEEAQQKAHQKYLGWGLHDFSHEWTKQTMTTALGLLGVEVTELYYRGFSSQGDGACLEGMIRAYPSGGLNALRKEFPNSEELHKLAQAYVKAQSEAFYRIRGTFSQSGHYSHSGCTSFDLYTDASTYEAVPEDAIIEALRAFMDYAYCLLESDYNDACSFERFQENAACNDWHFTEDGTMKND